MKKKTSWRDEIGPISYCIREYNGLSKQSTNAIGNYDLAQGKLRADELSLKYRSFMIIEVWSMYSTTRKLINPIYSVKGKC